jgi:hypothetical protein
MAEETAMQNLLNSRKLVHRVTTITAQDGGLTQHLDMLGREGWRPFHLQEAVVNDRRVLLVFSQKPQDTDGAFILTVAEHFVNCVEMLMESREMHLSSAMRHILDQWHETVRERQPAT